MQTLDAFEFRSQGRRPAMYAALGLGMGLTYVNHRLDAPLLAWVLVSCLLAVALHALAFNRAAGLRLGRGRLEVFDGAQRRNLALARISGAELGHRSCLLHFTDGSRLALPRAALPPSSRLAEELRNCGVPVRHGTMRATMPVLARR